MEIVLFGKAKEDFEYWKKSGNKTVQNKITTPFSDMLKNPYTGIGKPEALKYNLSGKFSRRINQEHRIVYDVTGNVINVYSLRGHY